MKLLERYYGYPLLENKIKDLEADKLRLEKELVEMSARRQSDIEAWNRAFDLERKSLLAKNDELQKQLLRVFGIVDSPLEAGQNVDKAKPETVPTSRPGSQSIAKDVAKELEQLDLVNLGDRDTYLIWRSLQDPLDREVLEETTSSLDQPPYRR